MNNQLAISVVVPNYNGRQLLEENLPAVYEAITHANLDFEIIVSDDASNDDSIGFLRTKYPSIRIIVSAYNRGFAPTANAGIIAAKHELVFLMNSDVKLTPAYFAPQLKYFEDPDTFGVMGRIIGLSNDIVQDGAKIPYRNTLKIGSDKNAIPLNYTDQWMPTLYLSGANALMSRQKLLTLQGFDEAYAPFYGEDLELCFRAWKAGWKCYYEHESICRHPASVTISKYNKKRIVKIISYRNRFIMHSVHLSGIDKLMWNTWIGLQLLGKLIMVETCFLKGFLLYLKRQKQVAHSRNSLKNLRAKQNVWRTNKEIYHFLRESINAIPHKIVGD